MQDLGDDLSPHLKWHVLKFICNMLSNSTILSLVCSASYLFSIYRRHQINRSIAVDAINFVN